VVRWLVKSSGSSFGTYRTDPNSLLVIDTIVSSSADGTRFGRDRVSKKYQDVMFSISVFDHGGFYSSWNVVVELICYTSHRNERNLLKQAIAGC
jgi:hypothetical protein